MRLYFSNALFWFLHGALFSRDGWGVHGFGQICYKYWVYERRIAAALLLNLGCVRLQRGGSGGHLPWAR